MPERYSPVTLSYTRKFCAVSVPGSIALVNRAMRGALMGMLVSPLCGLVWTTWGLTVSLPEPVVNVLWNIGELCPAATSVTATV